MSPRAGTANPVPTGSILLTHIKRLATHNAELGEISDATVLIRGNIIEWVGPSADPHAKLLEELQHADVIHDLSNHVVLPGLVNTHHHSAKLCRDPPGVVSAIGLSCCVSPQYIRLAADPSSVHCIGAATCADHSLCRLLQCPSA